MQYFWNFYKIFIIIFKNHKLTLIIKCYYKDPFDASEFVERLAWKTVGGSKGNADNFDPMLLFRTFEKTIKDLKEKKSMVLEQVNMLETKCEEEEKIHWAKVAKLHKHNQVLCWIY